MNKLKFIIKPNDEVRLKHKIGNKTVLANIGKLEFCFWADKTVVVVATSAAWGYTNDKELKRFHYIRVRDRSGNEIRLPISAISRSYALRRDHKRYNLSNKTLISQNG
jgi:hypothetical protein